jgi:formylmethanofuran dehydrogenase subunit B
VAIGPRASEAPFPVEVAIDTGIAGIHEGGIAYRLDDVPLPLTPALGHPRSAAGVLAGLARALARQAAVR